MHSSLRYEDMMKRILLVVLLCASAQGLLRGQERYRVVEDDAGRAALLSRLSSIDHRRDSHYVVYASVQEREALLQHGFRLATFREEPCKGLRMALSLDEWRQGNAYPTYGVYLQLLQHWAESYPSLCCIDTIGRSVQGRLILCARLSNRLSGAERKPQFFYSAAIHGDELTGFYLLLRLADTLLNGYGSQRQCTQLLDSVEVFINPLANPDGAYYGGDHTVALARRYNARSVDLNRNFPDPFGTPPLNALQPENEAMMAYVQAHRFRLSANLHGGAEVLNYPWDSFTGRERPHPSAAWWQTVCKKFVDTVRACSSLPFDDVTSSGYVAGGDWYVIPNGRQDWMNFSAGCLEMTMELSTTKKLASTALPIYWEALQSSLMNYIHAALRDTTFLYDGDSLSVSPRKRLPLQVSPNPTTGVVYIVGEFVDRNEPLQLYDLQGRRLCTYPAGSKELTLQQPSGIYLLRQGRHVARIIKY